MNRKLMLMASLLAALVISGCSNLKTATKSSSSLTSFLGVSELPNWYITSRYSYLDSYWIINDFGHSIHYRDLGEGPTVLLIHGEMDSVHAWEPWIENLSANFRVIAIDLPGAGLTGATHCVDDNTATCADNLSQEYLEHTLEYFIDDLNLRDLNIVASSYGGFLAANYALKRPDNVEKLVLISPAGFQQETPASLALVTNTGIISRYFQPAMMVTNIISDFFAGDSLSAAHSKRFLHLSQGEGMQISNIVQLTLVEDLMDHGTTSNFDQLETETLVLWGEKDAWSSFTLAKQWDETLPNSQLISYPELGHELMLEYPELTVADVSAYFLGDPMPSIEGLGIEGSFTIDDAASELNREDLFGPGSQAEEQEMLDEL